MRALIQRVKEASVFCGGEQVAEIHTGLLVFLGFAQEDSSAELEGMIKKILCLRVFDRHGAMDLSLQDTGGELLVVPQFTLYGEVKKGNRPSFTRSMPVEAARQFWSQEVLKRFSAACSSVQFGVFQGEMQVRLVNDGPVTLWLDSGK